MNSIQRELINIIDSGTKGSVYGEDFARRVLNSFVKNPNAGFSEVLYLLDEKIYYLLGWASRHEEEGVMDKAATERKDAAMLENILKQVQDAQTAAQQTQE